MTQKLRMDRETNDFGYEPKEINGSDYYELSIWEWMGDRYEKIYG